MSARPKTKNGKTPSKTPKSQANKRHAKTAAKTETVEMKSQAAPGAAKEAAAPSPVSAEAPKPVPAPAPAANGKAFFDGQVERFEQSVKAAGSSARAVNAKLLDIAQTNVNTGLEFARDLAGARTPLEVLRLQMAYWHECFGAFETQAQELRTLSAELVAASSEPIRTHLRRRVRN